MRNPFWKSTRILWSYKRLLAMALFGALISAASFGAGLGMILPTLHVLLGGDSDQNTHRRLVRELEQPDNPPHVQQTSQWLKVRVEEHYLPPLKRLIRDRLVQPEQPPWVRRAGAWLIEHVPHDEFTAFMLIMAVIVVMAIIGSIGRYIHELFTLTVIFRAAMVWRGRMLRRLVHSPMVHILQSGTSDYVSRIVVDTNLLSSGYQAVLGRTLAEILKAIAALGAAFMINWRLTAAAALGVPLAAVLLRKFAKRIRRASRRALEKRGRMIGRLRETMDSLPVVKVNTAEGYERRRFSRVNRELYGEEMKVRRIRALSSPVIETLALFGMIALACISAWLIFRQGFEAKEFFTVLIMLGAAASTLKPISSMNNDLAQAGAAAGRIFDLLKLPVEPIGVGTDHRHPILPRHRRQIVFDQVSFAYPGQDRPAVNDVNLTIPFGKTIAIVGGNGSGKTTLLSLLPRLLDPSVGRVTIDGMNISHVNLRSLREQIAVVSQQSVLFQGTLADNIAYGRRHESMERIVAASKAAFADDFISTMPKGYHSPLGEAGTGLSGGQRQRVCIARAILRDPAIMILDEATSQIDADSEAKINAAIRGMRAGRTIFVIAHRLSTVIDADQIVVMHNGCLVDQGTHEELLRRCDIYQTLTANQFGVAAK